MEFADDFDLEVKIKEQQKQEKLWSEEVILDTFIQICLALKYAHNHKILHRDLKAANIFMSKGGIVKLGDFGVASVQEHTKSKKDTQIGTPLYMSPEMLKEERYDAKSDIWSLGILLYEMCALQHPFTGSTLKEVADAVHKCEYE